MLEPILCGKDDLYSSKIFLNAALPLAKVIAMDIPKLGDKFKKTHAVIQVSALDPDSPEGKVGTHFVINSGEWLVHAGRLTRNPHIELEFQSIPALNKFFKGQMGPDCIPKFHLKVKYVPDLISFVIGLNAWYTDSNRELALLTTDQGDLMDFENRQREHTLRSVLSWDHTRENWKVSARK